MADHRTMDAAAPVPIRPTVSHAEPSLPDRIVRDTLASLRAADVYGKSVV